MSEPLLNIHNYHSPTCGDPPVIHDGENCNYIGYFENAFREQWIFTRDRKTGIALLRGGDVGWNQSFNVTDGSIGKLVLNQDESRWLQSCLAASRQ